MIGEKGGSGMDSQAAHSGRQIFTEMTCKESIHVLGFHHTSFRLFQISGVTHNKLRDTA